MKSKKDSSKLTTQEQKRWLKSLCVLIVIDIIISIFLLILLSINPSGNKSSTSNLTKLGMLFFLPILHIPMIPVGAVTVNKARDLNSKFGIVLGYIAAFLIPITLLLAAFMGF